MDTLIRACVELCLRRYGWGLLDEETLVALVEARCRRDQTASCATAVRAATFAVYSAALYRACAGGDGAARREAGYADLAQLLSRLAARRYSEVQADATQRALEQICRRIERCRKHEAFLAFALQALRTAARTEYQALGRVGVNLVDGIGAQQQEGSGAALDTVEVALQNDLRRQVAVGVRRSLDEHPRAGAQLRALWMTYIDGLDDTTIAARLGKTRGAVQVLRSRGLSRLRDDHAWQQLAREHGLLPGAATAP